MYNYNDTLAVEGQNVDKPSKKCTKQTLESVFNIEYNALKYTLGKLFYALL